MTTPMTPSTNPARDEAVPLAAAIDVLTDGEGDSVTFCCKNPDFNGLPDECVVVNASWTGWQDRAFRADTRQECLALAMRALRESCGLEIPKEGWKPAAAPAPAIGVDAVAVKVEPLKFVRPPNAETLIKAETILGDACIWTHREANGAWFWKLGDFASGTEASKGDAHKMLVASYEQRIRSALSPAATSGSEAGGWQDIKTAPKGQKVLVKFQSGEVEVCYQTDHGGGLMDSWRYAFARRGEQAPWPTEWCEIAGAKPSSPAGGDVDALRSAAKEFCRRVEAGEIRSKRSYAAFKAALSPSTSAAEPVVYGPDEEGLYYTINVAGMREACDPPAPAAVESYQARVGTACAAVFDGDPTDVSERRDRFAEEALETCQAFGMTREDMHALVDYTFGRPVGEPAKEIGAAMTTLASLCVYSGHNLMACAEADLAKLQRPETVARIRAKRATRHGRGSLPGLSEPAAVERAQEVKLPRLTEAMIRAACKAHYGSEQIDGIAMTSKERDWNFRQAFKRMWSGVRASIAAEKEG